MVIDGWKVVAIISMVLLLVETLVFAALFNMGLNEVGNKETCSVLCNDNGYDAFHYANNVCSCYSNNELVYQEELQ